MNKHYLIYDYFVTTNFDIPIIKPLCKYKIQKKSFSIYFIQESVKLTNDLQIIYDDKIVKIITCLSVYEINYYEQKIIVRAPNIINVISTIFNVSFALLSLIYSKILLHASSFIHNNSIYAFCR